MGNSKFSVKEIVLAGLFAGVVAALRIIPPIPLPLSPVPITSQTLGVMLAGTILGARTAGLALVTFLLLVAAGAPVLASGQTGLAALLGPTGGYVLSWPLAAYVTGWIAERRPGQFWWYVLANFAGGILIVYAIGAPVMAWVTGLPLAEAMVAGALVFVPGDLVKALAGAGLAVSVHRALHRAAPLAPGLRNKQ